MTTSKRHSINGAKVQGVHTSVCVCVCVRQGPLALLPGFCVCVREVQVWEGGGCEAHHQGLLSTTEKGQKARRIGTED